MNNEVESRKEVISMDEHLQALRARLAWDVECPHCEEVECTFLRCKDAE